MSIITKSAAVWAVSWAMVMDGMVSTVPIRGPSCERILATKVFAGEEEVMVSGIAALGGVKTNILALCRSVR